MTFKGLQDEVIGLRFDESRRGSVKSWLNLRYAALWAKADWHFKHVRNQNVSITASDPTPTIPVDFAKSEGIYDQDGAPLIYLTPREFDEAALPTTATATTSPYFTVVDRELWLSPTPGGTATYKLSYLRRLAHIDAVSGAAAPGVMVLDGDSPVWDAEYDYLLVLEACILGQQLLNDPTWHELVPQRDEILASMIEDLVGGQRGEFQQWGASCF